MRKKSVSLIVSLIFISSIFGLAFKVQIVGASGTIYIRADGSVDPDTALISSVDNVTYTFTDNIYDVIFVERDNVIVDGAGHVLQGIGGGRGIELIGRSNVTIKNMEVKEFLFGIYLYESSNNTIYGNNVTANNQTPIHLKEGGHGIRLVNSIKNSIFGNRIRNNWYGIRLINSTNNDISGNYIANNDEGVQLYQSSNNNTISGNVLVSDGLTVYDSYENVVDDNWVNGKSLVYLEDVSDCIIEDAGQVILVNCSHISVRNSRLSNTTTGVQLSQTKNTEISGNNITANSDVGILLLYESSNNIIFGNYIANNDEGVQLYQSSNNNTISGNNITANIWDGVQLYQSSNNSIFSNSLTANSQSSIRLYQSSKNNIIFGNYIANNNEAIKLDWYCVDNVIYHNNFIDNVLSAPSYGNFWDAGYPSGGNYWSNYEGADLYSGKGQNEIGRDGIGDTRYGQDNYPLMGMFSDFNATSEYHVQTICNSSISDFQYNGTALSFNVTGEDDTAGFCRICIPTTLMNETYKVFINGTEVSSTLLPCSNTTHSYLYFTYNQAKQEVIVIQEFTSLITLPLIMATTIIAIAIIRRRRAHTY